MKSLKRLIRYLIHPREFYKYLFRKCRLAHFKIISDCKNKSGRPICVQPVLQTGPGYLEFGKNVKFGIENAPEFYNSYCFLNVRNQRSRIIFGNDIIINNNFKAISAGEGIYIRDRTIIGVNVTILDTDFHNIEPEKRMSEVFATKAVNIGENVWIGNNVIILKGSKIGSNSVIATGAVVTKEIPDNSVAGGIPCKVIKTID